MICRYLHHTTYMLKETCFPGVLKKMNSKLSMIDGCLTLCKKCQKYGCLNLESRLRIGKKQAEDRNFIAMNCTLNLNEPSEIYKNSYIAEDK